ncbi:hypothetical protein EK904_008050 [Melospiza melodia maxima]|nr:hypothetical protein EK904_008050 [Melospiza melodia maxima]
MARTGKSVTIATRNLNQSSFTPASIFLGVTVLACTAALPRLDLADCSKQILFPKAAITADGIADHWINEQEFLEMT